MSRPGLAAVRRLAVVAGMAAALTAAAGAAATGPASAGTNCEGGFHCVFFTDFNSARHDYFNGDSNFTNDTFNEGGTSGEDAIVNDNVWSASNSSTGGYASIYYYGINRGGGMVFCVRPGSQVSASQLSSSGSPGDGAGQRDEASSLELRRTGIPGSCF